MPGQNLQKLSRRELRQLRRIVKRVYFKHIPKRFHSTREFDKLIDSLLPATIEKLVEAGEAKEYLGRKKFFLPVRKSRLVNTIGKAFGK